MPETARAVVKEATIYGFPMVDNYRILYSYFVDKGGPEYKAPLPPVPSEQLAL
jgi:hypothetical protein